MNREPSPTPARLATHIPGLDGILEGGLLKGGVYIVQGPPGGGKTILSNQICFNYAARGGRAVYMTLLAESHTRMISHLRRMRFFKPEMIPERIAYLSGFKVLQADGLAGLRRTLQGAITDEKAGLLVLDGLLSVEYAAPNDEEFKKFIHEVQIFTGMTGCTVLLLSSTERPRAFHPAHTMVDGILEMGEQLHGARSMRHLHVRKLRGAAQISGQHTFEISDEGIAVRPRLETRLRPRFETSLDETDGNTEITPGPDRKAFGVPALDEMLHGGLPAHSMTMLIGSSGAGKTMLALHFLAEGARQGERGVYFGFYERPHAIRRKSERLQLGLHEPAARKLVSYVWQPPVEGVLDVLGDRLLQAVRESQATRLVIDGVQGFELAAEYPERIRDVFAAIADELESLGVTTLYTSELRELFGKHIEVPFQGLSNITQNALLLRQHETDTKLTRTLAIVKLRDSDYDSSVRTVNITSRGIVVEGPSRKGTKKKLFGRKSSRRG